MTDTIVVEVAYGVPDHQFLKSITVASGVSIRDVILQSRLLQQFPDLNIDKLEAGIFSNKMPLDHILSDGDRIEIYRPLLIDPKEARRRRAKLKKQSD
jgi:putative ubiquitin-RnfH superfamily antitoxin RatB of RatAB toxin-antitoxin module